MDDKWFRHAIVAMVAGLAWFMATETMYRFGIDRISPDTYIGTASPLTRLWTLQLMVYFIAAIVAVTVILRFYFMFTRSDAIDELLPGIALGGTLSVLTSLDSGLTPHPAWFAVVQFAFICLLPLVLGIWMIRLSRRKPIE